MARNGHDRKRHAAKVHAATRGAEAGFTLMEVLIAMLVLVTGMVSILALFTHAVTVHRQAVDDSRAAMVAEAVLDRVRMTWDESGDPATVQALTFEDAGFAPFAVETSIADYGDSKDALAVSITLTWRLGNKEQLAEYHSVVLRDSFATLVAEARAGRTQ